MNLLQRIRHRLAHWFGLNETRFETWFAIDEDQRQAGERCVTCGEISNVRDVTPDDPDYSDSRVDWDRVWEATPIDYSPAIDMQLLINQLVEQQALKVDLIGLSVLKDYLGFLPHIASVREHALMSRSVEGIYNKHIWKGEVLCLWTDMRVGLPGDGEEHLIPSFNAIYRLTYREGKMRIISNHEYYAWLEIFGGKLKS